MNHSPSLPTSVDIKFGFSPIFVFFFFFDHKLLDKCWQGNKSYSSYSRLVLKESYQQRNTERQQEHRIGGHGWHVAFLHRRLSWPQSVSTHGPHQTGRVHSHWQTLTFDILTLHPLSLSDFSGFPSFMHYGRKLGRREKLMLLLTSFIMALRGTHTYAH